MGWTSYNANFYKNGKIDRKAECDSLYTQHEHDGYPQLRVVKSTMVGKRYYAAVESSAQGREPEVFGVVVLTSVNNKSYFNFGYKDMDETMGPYAYDCPPTILDLLSPTDNKYALEWRRKCREHHAESLARRKARKTLSDLPELSRVRFTRSDGAVFTFKKISPGSKRHEAKWIIEENGAWCYTRTIPDGFVILE